MRSSGSTATRLLWLGLGSALAVVALAFGTLQTVSALAHDTFTENLTFPAAGISVLEVDADNGSVEITGADVEEISVVAEVSDGLFGTRHDATVEGGTLQLQTTCPPLSTWCSVDYRVVVPRPVSVVLHATNHVTVRDVTGYVRVDADNGRVDLARLGGDLAVNVDNGRLTAVGLRSPHVGVDADNGRIELDFAAAPAEVTASSDNGSVDIVVPDTGEAYRVDVRTDNGSQDVGVRTDPESARAIVVRTSNGSVTVRYPASPPRPDHPDGRDPRVARPRPRSSPVSLPTTLDDRRTSRTAVDTVAARAIDAVKVYGGGDTAVRALDGVTVDIPAGRFTAVMGPSGSGKSTLMHCLAGLDGLTSGHVLVGDVELGTLSDAALTRLRRDRIGFVFQAFNLIPTLTVAENITLPLRLAGRKPDRAWVDRVVETVRLADRLAHRPSELSGGQQQRVAVARALASRPHIVFADEPTGNLDSRSGAEVLGLLRQAVDGFGQTVVMVTHDPAAAAWADAGLFLADGRIVDRIDGPTAEGVLERMKELS